MSATSGHHWLTFDFEQPGGPISGCHCGFETDFEQSRGWGDDVVAHIVAAGKAATYDTP